MLLNVGIGVLVGLRNYLAAEGTSFGLRYLFLVKAVATSSTWEWTAPSPIG
jgi:hypothetical protein